MAVNGEVQTLNILKTADCRVKQMNIYKLAPLRTPATCLLGMELN